MGLHTELFDASNPLIKNGDMSQATVVSQSIQLGQMVNCAFQAVFTGSPVGVIKLQVTGNNGVTWTDVAGSAYSITTAGDVAWDYPNIGFPLLRCIYTKTSGTGTLNVYGYAKG